MMFRRVLVTAARLASPAGRAAAGAMHAKPE